ncbi:MAG: hypothetical protein E7126_00085 [Rikenellaceae bacterium]|nr:hypothetical protein [Rikenellaceae bacterium]
MKKFLFPLFALVLSLASCQSDIDILNVQPEFETPVFTASIEEETRTNLSLNDNSWKILWVDTDRLSVFSKSDHNLRYKVSSITNNGTYADFVYMKEYVRGSGVNYSYNYSAYPYYKTTKLVDECIQMDIPSTQYYVEGDDMYYVPMVAKSPTLNLKFKAPSSVLNIAMNKEDNPNEFKLMSVTVSSSSVDLAGRVSIDMSGDTFVAHIDPSLGDTSKSVTLDLGEGVELTTDIKNFPIALPEVVFPENDFVVTCHLMVSGEERVLKVTRDKSLTFEGGRVKRLTVNVKTDSFFGNGGGEIDGEINIEDDMIIDEPLVVPAGGTANINLNGTVSLLPTNPNSSLVVVEEGGELTIDGEGAMTTVIAEPTASALSATRAASNTAFPIVVNGTLRIKGGDFTLNSYATSWLDCGIYIGPNGKLIVEGGTFRSTKGSYIFGHEFGKRPDITIHGGRFEGYDPSDNDFDGEGSNYLEPEYASYYVAEDELVVAERTAEWEVDNSYLLNSILKNGGNATLIDSVHDNWAFNVDNNINVNYPVNISVSGDASKVSGECILYIETPINCYADVNIKCDYTDGDLDPDSYAPDTKLLYIDSNTAIANVYNGATLTLGDATYFGGSDEVSETLFNLYGGNIVVNDGSYTLSERINAANMFVVDPRYAEESSLVVNGGVFYGYNPESVAFGEEVKNCVPEGKGALLAWDGGHYTIKNKGTFTAASYNVDGLPSTYGGISDANTTAISNKLATENWDMIAFQENFAHNTQLTSALSSMYTFGTWRGSVGIAQLVSKADTDGLGFAALNSTTSFSGEKYIEFNDSYGGLLSGANDCIKKGFRYYLITLPGGAQIDLYITHMNSGSDSGHINARASQFQQLANYIVANMTTRPTLVLGDFNARYTRDDYTTNFFSILGEAGHMDFFNDAWVELVDKYDINGNLLYAAGEYPDYPSDSLVVTEKYEGAEGDIECTAQGGEVVDKIYYINNPNSDVAIFANSFVRDMEYCIDNDPKQPLADHMPVVSEFTYYY